MARVCAIQKYVDRVPGPGRRDYRCGALTTEEHDGTDFRLRRNSDIARNVPVIAAAAGTVLRVRDGMPDEDVTSGRVAIGDRLAGNAVVIDHGAGWVTQYSHLKQGSVRVRPGQRVAAGAALGFVGMSGNAEFVHLHFEVRHDGATVDPFAATSREGCGRELASLWTGPSAKLLGYHPVEIMSAGFAPNIAAVRQSSRALSVAAELVDPPALLFWATAKGIRADDLQQVRILAPDGEILLDRTSRIGTGGLDWYGYAGVRRPAAGWRRGRYSGIIILKRNQKNVGTTEAVISVQ
jgi:murein DD-endopeptidase MepM/ murein hydrolase activator NlpD